MNGMQIYNKISEIISAINVICISGYTSIVLTPDVNSGQILTCCRFTETILTFSDISL